MSWFKSSYSCANPCVEVEFHRSMQCSDGTCVEVGFHDGHVLVRDSKDREGSILRFTKEEWQAFVLGVKDNEFDF